MNVALKNIERDTTIQCRAQICMETVNRYAEDMTEGATFPSVILFGTEDRCWIGDGWHRVMAAEQIGAWDIPAELKPGGRADALKYALKANSSHGQPRTNADKRRCVEIALKEFSNLSSRAIAEICGVSHVFVESIRPSDVETVSTRTDSIGRQQPAKRPAKFKSQEDEEAFYLNHKPEPQEEKEEDCTETEFSPAEDNVEEQEDDVVKRYKLDANAIAEKVVFMLSGIKKNDAGKADALNRVIKYCQKELRN